MASTPRKPRTQVRSTGKVIPLEVESRVVRWDKVAKARERIAAGHYDRPEVRERMIEALLEELRER